MNPGTIPVKTDKDRKEVEVRTDALDTSQRRLLILVDGTPTVNDLGAYVRVGDLDGALAYLFQTLDAQTVARQFDAMLL